MSLFDCIYSFIYVNVREDIFSDWIELTVAEEAQVLQVFGQWALEQEEHNERS